MLVNLQQLSPQTKEAASEEFSQNEKGMDNSSTVTNQNVVKLLYRVYKKKLNKFEIALNVAKRLKV